MAKKNVSVRLSAEGGKQVRAEMTGIGDAGAKGFKKISKEAEAANRKLAAFARAAKLAAAAAAGAALAAGVAMVRSGLQTIDAQAKLAASLGTTVASMQVLERAGDLAGVSMGEVEQATVQLTRRLSQAAAGTGPAVKALAQLHLTAEGLQKLPLDERIAAIQDALAKYVPEAQRAAVASQLFGDRASLTFGRIDSATLRQATADVRDFGVATSEADAAQIQITNDAISRLGLVWRGLANQLTAAVAPSMEAVANAMAAATRVGGTFQKSIGFLGRNLGEMASVAGAFATFFAGRFVFAMGAAVLGLRGVTAGLVTLKGALIRSGIGLAIVGVGELAFRMNLFGEAADQSSAAQTRMNEALGLYANIGGPDARAEAIASAKAYLDEAAAKLADAEATLAQMRAKQIAGKALLDQNPLTRGDTSQGSMGEAMAANVKLAEDALVKAQGEVDVLRAKIKEIEESDPAAPLNAAIPAANGLGGALGGAAGQASALSRLLDGLPGALANSAVKIAGLRASIAVLASGGDAAAASLAKFRAEAIATTPVLANMSLTELKNRGAAIDQLTETERVQAALTVENNDLLAALSAVATAARSAGAAGSAAGEAHKKAIEAALAAALAFKTGWETVTSALSDYAANARDISGDIGKSLVGAFTSAETAVADFVRTGKLNFRDLVTSMIADIARLSARQFILGPIANVLSGALGNVGGIAAGVLHAGGTVGGAGPARMVPAMAFAGAPRMHSGGFAGLRPDEVPAILQRGERVLSRREVAGSGQSSTVNVTIMARDAESFRQSRTQVASDIARAVSLGRRGM